MTRFRIKTQLIEWVEAESPQEAASKSVARRPGVTIHYLGVAPVFYTAAGEPTEILCETTYTEGPCAVINGPKKVVARPT